MIERLKIGIVGAGRWARSAHLPGFARSPLSEVVAICDLNRELAEKRAEEFGVEGVYTDYREMLRKEELDVVDVCTRASPDEPNNHERLVFAALETGRHCLCEKPVAHDYRNTWRAHRLAESKGLKTKVGLTFRYAPAMQYMHELIAEGFIGEPFIFNGFEQNSQFISPVEPVTKADLIPGTVTDEIKMSSLEGYGAPIIDLSLWFMGSNLTRVVGVLKNFVPYRTNADCEKVRTNIDDGDIYIGEYANGAVCSIQSSYVTVGNYPGLEARAYGSEGALICRLVDEFGVCQTLHKAKPDAVEFVPLEIPERLFPPGHEPGEPWPSLFYSNLIHNFNQEIVSGGEENQGNFAQSARVQEIINAVELSHKESRWISLPLDP
ncbi:MAG TPA: Gfo/Idh/MocA family oxidoreductase [Patescibacteria group bacterium]|nr:Gfo/Idh/MocA family oxidoreductase [Patescibacteria group bacterium]